MIVPGASALFAGACGTSYSFIHVTPVHHPYITHDTGIALAERATPPFFSAVLRHQNTAGVPGRQQYGTAYDYFACLQAKQAGVWPWLPGIRERSSTTCFLFNPPV